MKRVSFLFFVGTKDCGHSYVLRGTDTSGFVFRGTDILIAFGFSLGLHGYRHQCFILGFPDAVIGIVYGVFDNKLSFLMFNKGCLRMSSVLEMCWSYSIQA